MRGFYFNVNISERNENIKHQNMIGCFQAQDDLTEEKSQMKKEEKYTPVITLILYLGTEQVWDGAKDETKMEKIIKKNQYILDKETARAILGMLGIKVNLNKVMIKTQEGAGFDCGLVYR